MVYERDASVGVGVLFAAYREWCETEEVKPFERMSQKAIARAFEERGRGVGRVRDTTNRAVFTGVRLRLSTDPEHPEDSAGNAGSPYTSSDSEKFRQVPPNAPDAPEAVSAAIPGPDPLLAMGLEVWADDLAESPPVSDARVLKLTTDWPTPSREIPR